MLSITNTVLRQPGNAERAGSAVGGDDAAGIQPDQIVIGEIFGGLPDDLLQRLLETRCQGNKKPVL